MKERYYDATRGLPLEASEQVTNSILEIVAATPETQFLEVGIGGRIALPIVKRGFTYTAGHATYFEIRQLMQYYTLWQIILIVYRLTVLYEKDVLL